MFLLFNYQTVLMLIIKFTLFYSAMSILPIYHQDT